MSTSARFALGDETGDLTPGRDGWALWRLLHRNLQVLVQIRDVDGLPVIEQLVVRPADRAAGVTGTDLREVPLGRLAAALENKAFWGAITDAANKRVAPRFLVGELVTVAEAEAIAGGAELRTITRSRCLRLRIPAGRRKDRSFYSELFELYEDLKVETHRPAAEIANANGIDAAQVHHWIKQARDRFDLEHQRLSDPQTHDRWTAQIGRERLIEENWQTELDRRLEELGMNREEYCQQYGHAGAPDPVGVWDDVQRTAFLSTLKLPGPASTKRAART